MGVAPPAVWLSIPPKSAKTVPEQKGIQAMNPDRTVLTDFMWKRIEHILPDRKSDPGGTGRDNRLFPAAVLWRKRVGASWRDLPESFGKWNSVYKRFRHWAESGVFRALSEKFDLEHLSIDGTVVQAHRGEPGVRESAAPGAVCPARSSQSRTHSVMRCAS